MSTAHLNAMMDLTRSRAEEYLHLAKIMVINEFGPAAEHAHNEVTVALASAMMQHEGAQIIADAYRVTGD
jgi:hypothetical protein